MLRLTRRQTPRTKHRQFSTMRLQPLHLQLTALLTPIDLPRQPVL
jgi:hypothetical protein